MSDSWHAYPSIFALGHKALAELLLDPVIVEEKVDGSQFSFGWFPDYPIQEGYRCRSKGAELNLVAPEKMFAPACAVIHTLPLREGWTYRAEYLGKPQHNALAYDRVPVRGLILFDVNPDHEDYLSYDAKAEEAARIGLELVPRVFEGMIADLSQFRGWLGRVSVLGGQTVEGLVVKNYRRFGPDKKVLMGKFVSEAFKETHRGAWRAANPTGGDIVERLGNEFRTPARWQKALQHLQEAGRIEGSPRDIGLLFKEVPADVEKECKDDIRDALYAWAWPKVRRHLTAGLAEWYKARLLESQFGGPST